MRCNGATGTLRQHRPSAGPRRARSFCKGDLGLCVGRRLCSSLVGMDFAKRSAHLRVDGHGRRCQ